MKSEGYDTTLLHIRYGCRSQLREGEAVENIAALLKLPTIIVDTDLFKKTIQNNLLTDLSKKIPKGDIHSPIAYEWVPARNLIFTSIAIGIAEARRIDTIALGLNKEESNAYPDNTEEFVTHLNTLLPYATNRNKTMRIVAPLVKITKREIVLLGTFLKAPMHLSWSCYHSGLLHCGQCTPCLMRQNAFAMADIPDVIRYQDIVPIVH
jgi:7-cyano-7-deazaguanine synthase